MLTADLDSPEAFIVSPAAADLCLYHITCLIQMIYDFTDNSDFYYGDVYKRQVYACI